MDKEKKNNIFKTALVLEGGGMRCSFTAGVLNQFIEEGLFFNYIIAVSAGSSCLVTYMARDQEVMKRSFTDFVTDPNTMSWRSFFKGGGYMQSDYIYKEAVQEGGPLHIDFEEFFANPAHYRIMAYDIDQGPVAFTEKDIKSPEDLMARVQASSSLPLFMPETEINGHFFVDGGIYNGLPIHQAFDDGYDRILIIRTKTRDYIRPPLTPLRESILKRRYPGKDQFLDALFHRYEEYNKTVEVLKLMEAEDKALMISPPFMKVSNHHRDLEDLEENYQQGLNYARDHMEEIKAWIEKGEHDG